MPSGEAGVLPERTRHRFYQADARALPLPDESVELVVTSPPYPMIEMWDDGFRRLDPAIGEALDRGDGWRAYERMHELLETAWEEVARVLVPGGIACINIGDATRTVDEAFRRYPNHEAVTQAFRERGLRPLPDVLWHKPTNGPTKFMGSMRPPNGYVTLEHEYILPFRKGDPRSVDGDRRAASAYLWEERNQWFSDVWSVAGESQGTDTEARERAGAFPPEIPYRLVNMFSVQGETVPDPFCGTGTTALAAAASARHSIGTDRERTFLEIAAGRERDCASYTAQRGRQRLDSHETFLTERERAGDLPERTATHYDTRVVSERERGFLLPSVESTAGANNGWIAFHDRLEQG
jgi:DNA modification methylase